MWDVTSVVLCTIERGPHKVWIDVSKKIKIKEVEIDEGIYWFDSKCVYLSQELGHFQLVNIYKGCYRSHDLS